MSKYTYYICYIPLKIKLNICNKYLTCITNLLILYVYMYTKEEKDVIFLDINRDKSRSYL
jgi:hypothetical protein